MAQATSVLIAVAVLHHVINQAVRQLTVQGILDDFNEGIDCRCNAEGPGSQAGALTHCWSQRLQGCLGIVLLTQHAVRDSLAQSPQQMPRYSLQHQQ